MNDEKLTVDNRKNYDMIDIFKLISAVLVVFIHANDTPNIHIDLIVKSFSRFAVPFFFVVSGFFFKKGLDRANSKRDYFFKYQKKLILIYIFWALVNIPLQLNTYLNLYSEASTIKILLLMCRRIFLCGSGFVWYILAMIEAAAVIYLLDKYKKKRLLISLIIIGLILGMIYDSFFEVLSGTPVGRINDIFYTVFSWSNNFIMKGIPFMGLGYLFAIKIPKIKLSISWLLFCTASILNIVLCCLEYLQISEIFTQIQWYYILSNVQTVCFFLIAVKTQISIPSGICRTSRELSSAIYFLHPYMIYQIIEVIFGHSFNIDLKIVLAILASVVIYIIVKKLNIKPLKYVLNIK